MEQTNTPQQPSRKKAILSLLVLLALTCVVVFIFSSHWAEISTALAQLSFWQVLLVLAIGLTYPLLEGIVCWLIIRCRLPRSKAPSDQRRAPRQRTPLSQ